MPLTPGGKIDKRARPVPETTVRRDFVAPETPAQKQLAAVFADAPGLETVRIDDDFFAIDGSSLAASKMAVICMMKYIPLVYADIFKHPTVRNLEAVLLKNMMIYYFENSWKILWR